MLYVSQWKNISKKDRKDIETYIDNTDVIITLSDDGVYRVSAPQDDDRFTSYNDFINFVRFNLDCFREIGII